MAMRARLDDSAAVSEGFSGRPFRCQARVMHAGVVTPLEGALVATFAAPTPMVKNLQFAVSTTLARPLLPSLGRHHGAPILLCLVSVAS
jgi:hypothetical protein